MSHRELRQWMPWARDVPTAAEQRRALEEFHRQFEASIEFVFGIFETDDFSTLVGVAGLHLNREPAPAEIGYWVRSDRTGRGYATAATWALTTAAFQFLAVDAVHVTMDRANHASARVPAKLGYTLLGEEQRSAAGVADTGVALRWSMQRLTWGEKSGGPAVRSR